MARRWRAASYRHTPLATETLRLSTAPSIGRWTSSSQVLAVSWRRPEPSAPNTSASGPRQVERVDRARRVFGRADDADVALLQLAERAREVGDHEVRHRLGGAARHLGDRRVDADRMVLRRDHGMRAGAVGDAQAGAEVVRIGDAVEHQHQRRAAAPHRACRRANANAAAARPARPRPDGDASRQSFCRRGSSLSTRRTPAASALATKCLHARIAPAASTCSSSTDRGATLRRTPTA